MTTTAEKEYIISILAKNNPGVLLRISGLFSRRCYNILSIVAAQTENTEYSRILIVVQGDDRIVRQVDKQVSKLVDIEQVDVLDANILSVEANTMILELTGDATTINSFIELYNPYHVLKILRTGAMAMPK